MSDEMSFDFPAPRGYTHTGVEKGTRNAAEEYVTGDGQVLRGVHPRSEFCDTVGCIIHNPTDPNRDRHRTYWHAARGMMMRICEHNVLHPDKDVIAFRLDRFGEEEARAAAAHACDGCCSLNRDSPLS